MINDVIKLLQEIIAINTVNPPGNERALAEFLYRKGIEAGMEARLQPIDENRANLILRIKGIKEGGKSLIFNGHLDVVPAVGKWTSPPFVLTKRNDRLYGRGTCDMKGGLSCMFIAAERMLKRGFRFKGDLWLVFVADEECNNLGTNLFLKDPLKADCCVIGEPTGLDICYAHRGVFRPRVIIRGKSAHAAHPERGNNAIEKMAGFVIEVEKLKKTLLKQRNDPLSPTVAVTAISGGDKYNIIPDYCEAVLDYRTSPKETEETVTETLSVILDRLSENRTLFDWEIQRIEKADAGYLSPNSDTVKILAKSFRRTFYQEPVVRTFTACGEQSIFLKANIPTVYCGPGDISQAHTTDEYCEYEQLKKAEIFYESIIQEFLG
jgi:succinyl-diaminopimelate desuccinylase